MASLGNALVTKILGHSAAEKAFRPWWDNLEDFLVYSLVMLGLIVAPTTIINGTPLDCNFCGHRDCLKDYFTGTYNSLSNSNASSDPQTNPEFNDWWVKKYCTMAALDGFILYFPYLLLSIAVALVLIERIFLRIFRAGLKLNAFYTLIQKSLEDNENEDTIFKQEQEDAVMNKTALEVLHTFTSTSNYFRSYMIRTLLVTVISSVLLTWLILMGIPSMKRDEFIFCDVHGYHYECAGHPQQFYMYVLWVTVVILLIYIFCCLFNLVWLLTPQLGGLSRVMREYRLLHLSKQAQAEDPMGDLTWIYFKNKDLKLLLDLLATSSGISQSLSLLTRFDQKLRRKCVPSECFVSYDENGGASVSLSEAEAVKDLFSNLTDLSCIYTVQIYPPTIESSIEALKFKSKGKCKESDAQDIEMQAIDPCQRTQSVHFTNLIESQKYIFVINTLVNGHSIAKKILK